MSIRAEWYDMGYMSLNGILRGEEAADGQELDNGDMAVEIYQDSAAVIVGTAESLREFAQQIINVVDATEKRKMGTA